MCMTNLPDDAVILGTIYHEYMMFTFRAHNPKRRCRQCAECWHVSEKLD